MYNKPNGAELGTLMSGSKTSWWREYVLTSCGGSSWTSLRWLVNFRPRTQRQDVRPPHQPPQDSKATRYVMLVNRNNRNDNGRSREFPCVILSLVVWVKQNSNEDVEVIVYPVAEPVVQSRKPSSGIPALPHRSMRFHCHSFLVNTKTRIVR